MPGPSGCDGVDFGTFPSVLLNVRVVLSVIAKPKGDSGMSPVLDEAQTAVSRFLAWLLTSG